MLDPKSIIPYVLLRENFKNVIRNAATTVSEIQRKMTYFHAVLYLSYSSSLTEFLFLRNGCTNAIAVYFMIS